MSEHRKRLIDELADAEYRQHYAEQHLNATLATQIGVIREQRGLTQARLAESIHKHQTAISRIENVNYARWNVTTLKQIASALGCWLNVRLESWGALVDEVDQRSVESLRRDRFEDDPVFWGSTCSEPIPEAVRWVQRRLFPWLQSHPESDHMLVDWLQGRGLPPVGDEDPPHVWIIRSVEVEGPESKHRALLVGWLARYLPIAIETAKELQDPDGFLVGVFSLAATFRTPALFSEPIQEICSRLYGNPDLLSETAQAALLTAVIRNQLSPMLKEEWLRTIRTGGHSLLPADELDAFEGLKSLPPRPNLRALAEGLKCMQEAIQLRRAPLDLIAAMRDIKFSFPEFSQLDQFLARELADCGWDADLFRAWRDVFAPTYDDQIRLATQAYAFAAEPTLLPSEFLRLLREEREDRQDDQDLANAISVLEAPLRSGCAA
jgi:transcriptional regulator with XRE-family HTH domain